MDGELKIGIGSAGLGHNQGISYGMVDGVLDLGMGLGNSLHWL